VATCDQQPGQRFSNVPASPTRPRFPERIGAQRTQMPPTTGSSPSGIVYPEGHSKILTGLTSEPAPPQQNVGVHVDENSVMILSGTVASERATQACVATRRILCGEGKIVETRSSSRSKQISVKAETTPIGKHRNCSFHVPRWRKISRFVND